MRLSVTRVKGRPHEGGGLSMGPYKAAAGFNGLGEELKGGIQVEAAELGSYSWNRKESYLRGA